MYIEIGTLWYLLFAGNLAGASPESRRKIARAKFLLETRSRRGIWCIGCIRDGFWGLQSLLFIVTPVHHISSKNLINLSKNLPILQFFMSNNTFIPRISCFLNQFVGFFSELGAGMGCRLTAREKCLSLIKLGFYGFRRACSRDYAMRLWHFVIVACHNRMAWNFDFLLGDYAMRLWQNVIVAWGVWPVFWFGDSGPSCCIFGVWLPGSVFRHYCLWIEYELAPFLLFDSRMSILNACTHIS